MASLSDYANDPQVTAYLKALYANKGVANSPQASGDVAPFDAGLTQANNTADLNYNNTLTAIGAQEPALRRSYGYTDSGDIDPTNPFGKAQLLERSYKQAQTGNTNSYAARGQLYSGALQRRKNEDQFNYQANDAALRNQYATDIAGVAGQRATAMNTLNTTKSNNYWDWVNGQIAARAAGYGSAPAAEASPQPIDGGTQNVQIGNGTYAAGGYSNPGAGVQAAYLAADAGGYDAPSGARPGNSMSDPAFAAQQGLAALAPYANNAAVTAYLKAQYAKSQGRA